MYHHGDDAGPEHDADALSFARRDATCCHPSQTTDLCEQLTAPGAAAAEMHQRAAA
jgi:hypothetical protein